MSDLDILKEIPGYKAILKSVLKSQIHLLMEQLSEHTGEESIILTASVHDGSLSHLGSNTGKGFLEGRDEIKSQFLGYCLKTYHKKKTHEPQKPYQRTHPSPRAPAQVPNPPAKRSRLQPPSLPRLSPVETSSPLSHMPSETSDSNIGFVISGAVEESIMSIKSEQSDNQGVDLPEHTEANDSVMFSRGEKTVPDSVHLSHTQTSGAAVESGAEIDNVVESVDTENSNASEISSIKVEQVEDELEITGVEMAAGSLENWGQGQGQPGYGLEADSSLDQSADQSGYSEMELATTGQGDHVMPQFESYSPVKGSPYTLFPCPLCKKTFTLKGNLKKHYLIHAGVRPFVCPHCSKPFRQKITLKKHMLTIHKTAWTEKI